MIRRLIHTFFKWIFKAEFDKLESEICRIKDMTANYESQERRIKNMLGNIDVSVDVHEHIYSRSWAVISIQGRKADYIKFVDLGNKEIMEISKFLSRFDRTKIDASPNTTHYLRISNNKF